MDPKTNESLCCALSIGSRFYISVKENLNFTLEPHYLLAVMDREGRKVRIEYDRDLLAR